MLIVGYPITVLVSYSFLDYPVLGRSVTARPMWPGTSAQGPCRDGPTSDWRPDRLFSAHLGISCLSCQVKLVGRAVYCSWAGHGRNLDGLGRAATPPGWATGFELSHHFGLGCTTFILKIGVYLARGAPVSRIKTRGQPRK